VKQIVEMKRIVKYGGEGRIMNIKDVKFSNAMLAEKAVGADSANDRVHAYKSQDSDKAQGLAPQKAWQQFQKNNVGRKLGHFKPVGPEQHAAAEAQKYFQEQFGKLAADKGKFQDLMKEVYGKNYDAKAAEGFRQRALHGDYSWLPKIEFKSDAVLRGGNGAYDSSRNVVYINDKFLNDPTRAGKVYSEEVGHFLDTRLNKSDSVGDEGEYFRKLLAGEKLSAAEKAAIRADNDHGVIYVNGKRTEVEFSIFDDIGDGLKKVGGAIADGAKAVGGAIASGAKAVGGAIASGANAVWSGVKSVAGSVWSGVKSVAGSIWDGVKKAGNFVWDGMKKVGNAVADAAKWLGPRLWDGARGLATGAWNTVTGVVRNVAEGVETFFGGFGKIFSGDFSGGFKDLGLGLAKIFVQTPADAVLMMGGRLVSAVQTAVGLEPVGRKLTDAEISELKKVYGDSIDYSQVRIKEGNAGLFSLTGRPFTHGNTIYIPDKALPLQTEVLVHEMGHVWQNQHGGTDYMSEALWAQNLGDGYDYEKALGEGKSWSELNPEQQAELLETAYRQGFFDGTGRRFMVNGVDYTDYMNNVLKQVRSGQGAP
jgi:hypothetical protein